MSATEIGPDEKVCPYCAEVIKAAAVKCRYCHSDLPPQPSPVRAEELASEFTEEPAEAPEDAAPAAPEAPVAEPGETEPVARQFDTVVVGLTALCVVLAIVLTAIVLSSRPGALAKADDGQVTATSYRNAAMSAGSANASTILSYGYQTLAQDEKKARQVLTGKARSQYDAAMNTAGPKATEAKLTLKAQVLASSLASLTEHEAKVLVFVDATTTAEGSKQQQLDQNRVLLTMTRKDGDWIVKQIDLIDPDKVK